MWATALFISSSLLVCHVLNSLTLLTHVQIVIPHTNGSSLRTLTWLEVLLTVFMQLFLPVCTALHFFPVFFQFLQFVTVILDLNPILHICGLPWFQLVYRLKLTLFCHPVKGRAGLAHRMHPGTCYMLT